MTSLAKALLPVLLVALAAAACLPKPEEPVEWLHREDSVIVQMRMSGGLTVSPGGYVYDVPQFTLYGDGRMIYQASDAEGEVRLLESELSDGTIEDLLEEIVDSGFLDFPYELASPDNVSDASTTYLYINTKFAANATNAYALGAGSSDGMDEGDEFESYRELAKIVERLAGLPTAADAHEYQPEQIRLVVVAMPEPPAGSASPEHWPVDGITLASIASGETGSGERLLHDETAAAVRSDLEPLTFRRFQEDGRVFSVGYRPILPFEDHFPEFEPQQ